MKIRAVIVDDEPRARSRMRRLLDPHDDVVIVGEAKNGEEAVQKVLELRPDLLFLDVQMPGMRGTDAAARLRDYLPETVRPLLVFTTAHAEHAVEAFGLESLDYLLKPVERDRLADCLRRVRRKVWASGRSPVPAPGAPAPTPATLTAHRGASIEALAVNAILVVQVEDGIAFAYTVEGERRRLGDSLAEVESQLPAVFARVSRGAIVNTERVDRLVPKDSGTFNAVLEDGREVSVSRRRAKRLKELMGL